MARRGHQSKAHVSFSLIPCRLFLIDNSLVQIDFCVVFFFSVVVLGCVMLSDAARLLDLVSHNSVPLM